MSANASYEVVILHIACAWGHRPGVDPDYSARGKGCLDLLRLEVLIEKFGDALAGQRAPVFLALRS
jgi:hypothetical protein